MIELYLLHSLANEPEYIDADSLAQNIYDGIDVMLHEMTDAVLKNYQSIQAQLISAVKVSNKVSIQSLVEDRTNWASANYSDQTNDLSVKLRINKEQEQQPINVENATIQKSEDTAIYDILGRRIADTQCLRPGMIYIQNGKKFVVNK